MGASVSMKIEAQLATGVWSDLTSDSVEAMGLSIHYGVNGNRPTDLVASTGECSFVLNNMASFGGRPQGYYSPTHVNVRTGWGYGIQIRVVFTQAASTVFAAGITRSSTTATVTTVGSHGRSTGDWVTIAGADQSAYNGTVQIVVTGATTFTFTVAGSPATPATGTITAVQSFIKFTGKVRVIEPQAGRYSTQMVRVVCYDVIRDLAEYDLRSVSTQQSQTESELVQTVLAAVPAESQPVATDLDAGVDEFAVAFDDVGGGTKALTVIANVAQSALAFVAVKGDGTFRMKSRHGRVIGASLYAFDDDMIHGFSVPSSLDGVYNLVRCTNYPKAIDAAATTVLYAQSGPAPFIGPGETIEVWGSYTDPVDRQTPIGGVAGSFVDPLVATTDYLGNAAADGLGADRTSDVSISVAPFSSSCLFSITNTGVIGLYLTKRQIRGKGIYDQAPQTFEASSSQPYGVRPISIDLHYQDNPVVAQSAATFIEAQYRSLASQPNELMFIANSSSALLAAALGVEPGDRITVTEYMTGTVLVDVIVQSIDFSVSVGTWITCRLGLAPASPWRTWLIGIAGSSELGETTVLGF